MALVLENISKNFATVAALHQVNLSLPQQSITLLLGPNGAGKTTLQKIVAGLIYPDMGQISFNGQELNSKTGVFWRLGYVSDEDIWPSQTTVREFLILVARLKKCSDPEQEMLGVVQRLNLQTVLDRLIDRLSLGFRQRVQLAQALIGNPEVLLLDEPGNGLDPKQFQELEEILLLEKSQRIILISTHRIRDCEKIADRVAILDQGILSQVIEREQWQKTIKTDHLKISLESQESKLIEYLTQNSIHFMQNQDEIQIFLPQPDSATEIFRFIQQHNLMPRLWELGKVNSLEDWFFTALNRDNS